MILTRYALNSHEARPVKYEKFVGLTIYLLLTPLYSP